MNLVLEYKIEVLVKDKNNNISLMLLSTTPKIVNAVVDANLKNIRDGLLDLVKSQLSHYSVIDFRVLSDEKTVIMDYVGCAGIYGEAYFCHICNQLGFAPSQFRQTARLIVHA
jgi:hypothetical protein